MGCSSTYFQVTCDLVWFKRFRGIDAVLFVARITVLATLDHCRHLRTQKILGPGKQIHQRNCVSLLHITLYYQVCLTLMFFNANKLTIFCPQLVEGCFPLTKGTFVWEYSGIRIYSGIYSGFSAPGSRKARMEIQVFRNRKSSQMNANLHYSNYSYSGLIPNEHTLSFF